MTRHMVNHLSYANDTSLEYRHPSRLPIVPSAPNDRSFSLARSNPRADPMARQPSRPGPAPHVAGSSAAGAPRRRIPVAVCPSLTPLRYCTCSLLFLIGFVSPCYECFCHVLPEPWLTASFDSAGGAVNEKSGVVVTQGTTRAAIIANRLEWGQAYAFF